ncbi:unnamed protein product [Amoebophrya sp. A120]|nr:unnamed protein product [Amoebophrya sp. A120]|eukprot:GSA120T00022452001.1
MLLVQHPRSSVSSLLQGGSSSCGPRHERLVAARLQPIFRIASSTVLVLSRNKAPETCSAATPAKHEAAHSLKFMVSRKKGFATSIRHKNDSTCSPGMLKQADEHEKSAARGAQPHQAQKIQRHGASEALEFIQKERSARFRIEGINWAAFGPSSSSSSSSSSTLICSSSEAKTTASAAEGSSATSSRSSPPTRGGATVLDQAPIIQQPGVEVVDRSPVEPRRRHSSLVKNGPGATPSSPPASRVNLKLRPQTTAQQRESLSRQNYELIGSHSAVKLCRWTKNALKHYGQCYKHTFYGIESHKCMEMTPNLACANKCVFCWRNHTNPVTTKWKKEYETDEPEFVLEKALELHSKKFIKQVVSGLNVNHQHTAGSTREDRSVVTGSTRAVVSSTRVSEVFAATASGRGTSRGTGAVGVQAQGDEDVVAANHDDDEFSTPRDSTLTQSRSPQEVLPKMTISQNPGGVRHCALSLVGEPVLYPHLPRLLKLMWQKRISTFLVTNGQFPDSLITLAEAQEKANNTFCTQLYVSVDASNEPDLKKVGRPLFADAWQRLQKSLQILRTEFSRKGSKTRTVLRLTYLLQQDEGRGPHRDKEKTATESETSVSEIVGRTSPNINPSTRHRAAEFAHLLLTAEADFIEVKGATFAPQVFEKHGMSQKNVPTHSDVCEFARLLQEEINQAIAELHRNSKQVLAEAAHDGASPEDVLGCTSSASDSASSHLQFFQYGLAAEHHHSCGVLLARKDRWQCPETGRWNTWIDFDKIFERETCHAETASAHNTGEQEDHSSPTISRALSTTSQAATSSASTDPIQHDTSRSRPTPEWALYGSSEKGLSPEDRMKRSGRRPDDVQQMEAAH